MDVLSFKLVLVGDQQVQKTTLLYNYYHSLTGTRKNINYKPTFFQNRRVPLQVDNQKVSLSLCDTTGQQKYQLLRSLAYINADIILIAFLLDERETYINALQKWYPQVKQNCNRGIIAFLGVRTKQKQMNNTQIYQEWKDQNQNNRVQALRLKDCLYFQENDERVIRITVEECMKHILKKKRVSHERFECEVCQLM